MKEYSFTGKLVFGLSAILTMMCMSCGTTGTIVDRGMTSADRQTTSVQGKVSADFYTSGWSASASDIKKKAYNQLLGEARKRYSTAIEIKNIVIQSKYSLWSFVPLAIAGGGIALASTYQGRVQTGSHYAMGRLLPDYHDYKDGWKLGVGLGGGAAALLTFEFMGFGLYHIQASGDVVIIDNSVPIGTRVETALDRGSEILLKRIPDGSRIAILSIQSSNIAISEQVIDGLEYRLVNNGKFRIVERRELDKIREEQNFQLSGEVSDETAVSIGHMLGASVVITGSVIMSGSPERMTMKAIDVETAQILAMAREDL